MTAVAKAVYRGSDGSVHYLMSTPDSSLLVVTDPALGVRRFSFDGPCRLTRSGADSVQYESISATGSATVTVWPGQEPLFSEYGFCTSCAFPPLGQPGRNHDYEQWPVCPSGDRAKPAPAPERVQEPAQPSSTGTAGRPTKPSRGKARVRVLDAEPARVPEPAPEPVRGMMPVPVATEPYCQEQPPRNQQQPESCWSTAYAEGTVQI
jgi:hypothetical protein